MSVGGTAANGKSYRPPNSGILWGITGCPRIARVFRTCYPDLLVPESISKGYGYKELRVRDLDYEFVNRALPSSGPPGRATKALNRELWNTIATLEIPPGMFYDLVGIPIAWLLALPLSATARDVVLRTQAARRWNNFWEEDIGFVDLSLMIHDHFAIEAYIPYVNELLCVVESAQSRRQVAATSRTFRPFEDEDDDPLIESEDDQIDSLVDLIMASFLADAKTGEDTTPRISGRSPNDPTLLELIENLLGVANWAMAETSAQTLGQAIELAMSTPHAGPLWQSVADIRLMEVINQPEHPYATLGIWANSLGNRERDILDLRIAPQSGRPATLQDLGKRFLVTRERVRQLESKLRNQLDRFVASPDAAPVRWRVETIRNAVGTAAPTASIADLLECPPGESDYRALLLELAGPYIVEDGWVINKSRLASDPTSRLIASADDVGRISQELIKSELDAWGLWPQFHRGWLLKNRKIRELNGQWYRWDGSIADKLVAGLDDIGIPATIKTLMAHVHADRTRGSALNALSSDPRVVRINRTEWGLASWGYQEFNSIAVAMRDYLERAGEPVLMPELIDTLSRQFELRESSVRAYCEAPIFVLEGGYVRLRRKDEDYTFPNAPIRAAKSVFYLGPQRVARLLEVNGDLLRGSGHSLTHAAGAILNIVPDHELTFYDEDGISVKVTFPGTSTTGPSLGSVRALAENNGAGFGDYLTIILDRSNMSITATSTNVDEHEPGWHLLSRLVGLQEEDGMSCLQDALGCSPGEEREVLARRGDEVVKNALPTLGDSPRLNEALSALQAEFQRPGRPLT